MRTDTKPQRRCNAGKMAERLILLKYGEMVLKGLNRGYFNSLLQKRVRQLLAPVTPDDGAFELEYMQSTLYIRARGAADIDLALEKVKYVFGVVSICMAYETAKDMQDISSAARENAAALIGTARTFKCEAKRSDKSVPTRLSGDLRGDRSRAARRNAVIVGRRP